LLHLMTINALLTVDHLLGPILAMFNR
jgi:hypothetical protein